MFLTGLTLEVQEMVFSGKDALPVTLEIRSTSNGMREAIQSWVIWMEANYSNGGPVPTLDIKWIEGKLFLSLRSVNDEQELHDLKSAQLAEQVESAVAHVRDLEAKSPKRSLSAREQEQMDTIAEMERLRAEGFLPRPDLEEMRDLEKLRYQQMDSRDH